MRCLIDKNIVRYTILGLRDARTRPLTPLELGSLAFLRFAQQQAISIYISDSSYAVLQRKRDVWEVQLFLQSVQVLYPTRYHTRWSRRVREVTGLTREDAGMIALASFGSDKQGEILGVHWLATYDRGMVNGYEHDFTKVQKRFKAMTIQLQPPFNGLNLPQIALPEQLITEV